MDRRNSLISVFDDTLECISNDVALHMAQQQSIASQKLILETDAISTPVPKFTDDAKVLVTRNRSFEAAAHYNGQRVCVLNFASATNPGGGVVHGSSAQEECLCRCSTLYNCLNTRAMWDGFYTPHRRSGDPLHNNDIIFTPGVQVFKDDDYNVLPQPFSVDVITCAAPNLRPKPSNPYNPGEGDAPFIPPQELFHLHIDRARRVLDVAALNNAEVVILGAFGCGAFRNDPLIVARAYNCVIEQYLHIFRTIEFAVYCRPGDDNNYRTFKSIIQPK